MSEPNARDQYAALARRFQTHHQLPKGGVQLDYLSLAQVTERLTDAVGADNWEFEVREHGRDGDTLWALGRLTVHFPARSVIRDQFGECQTTRGMGDGDARKGAASDALKKAASLVGVGLYLSDKTDPVVQAAARPAQPLQRAPARQAQVDQSARGPLPAPAPVGEPAAAPRAVDGGALPGGATGQGEMRAALQAESPAYREPTEDEWIVFDDTVRERTGYSRADVCALLGRDPADHLRALHAAGTPKSGKALLADLMAYQREGRPIPHAVSAGVAALESDLAPEPA